MNDATEYERGERNAAWNRWLKTPAAEGYAGWCLCYWCRKQAADFHAAYDAGDRFEEHPPAKPEGGAE